MGIPHAELGNIQQRILFSRKRRRQQIIISTDMPLTNEYPGNSRAPGYTDQSCKAIVPGYNKYFCYGHTF